MNTRTIISLNGTKQIIALLAAIFLTGTFCPNTAFAQIDYYFGKNRSGVRLGFGVGANWLQNNYRVNTPKPNLTGILEYNISDYFGIGFKGQMGSLYGANQGSIGQPFASITNTFYAASFNTHFAVGLFSNFNSNNGASDAIKRLYLGTGVGYINSSVNIPVVSLETYEVKQSSEGLFIPFNIGTSIDLHITDLDKFELNPDYQFNIVNNKYFEGFSSVYTKSTLMFFSQINLNIKYKF